MEQQTTAAEPSSVPTNEELRAMTDDKKRFVEEEYDVGVRLVAKS